MARQYNEYELDDFDAEDIGRGRKLNKNAHRAERRARDVSRYAYDDTDDQSFTLNDRSY